MFFKFNCCFYRVTLCKKHIIHFTFILFSVGGKDGLVVNDVGVDSRLLLTTWRPQRLVAVAAAAVIRLDDHHLGVLRHLCCIANAPLQHTPTLGSAHWRVSSTTRRTVITRPSRQRASTTHTKAIVHSRLRLARCCPLVGQFKYRVHLFAYSSLVIIPAKAFASDYGITGVRLSVCLFVCLSVATITK